MRLKEISEHLLCQRSPELCIHKAVAKSWDEQADHMASTKSCLRARHMIRIAEITLTFQPIRLDPAIAGVMNQGQSANTSFSMLHSIALFTIPSCASASPVRGLLRNEAR